MTHSSVSVQKTIKGKLPSLPLVDIKNSILGSKYSLSIVFIGDTRSRTLNKKYRKKEYVPSVLSFPLSKEEGEIFINPTQARREAKKSSMSYKTFLGYLFIHGLLHLKGLRHGSTMNSLELKYCKQFFNK